MSEILEIPPAHIQGRTGPWELVMGLEIHAQIASQSTLFSGAAVQSSAERTAVAGGMGHALAPRR